MNIQEQVVGSVTDFIKAGDTNDIALLDRVLHKNFQNVQDGFFEEEGIFVFSKDEYRKLVETRRFGGVARTLDVKRVDVEGNMAHVHVQLKSKFLMFNSLLTLCREGGRWWVLHNMPTIVKK